MYFSFTRFKTRMLFSSLIGSVSNVGPWLKALVSIGHYSSKSDVLILSSLFSF